MDRPTSLASMIARARAERLVILCDLDGTLIPFAATAELASLDDEAVQLLDALHLSGVQVVIVSGRPQPLIEVLRARARHPWWVAEHGAWRCQSIDWSGPSGDSAELDELSRSLRQLAREGVRFERKSLSVCMHWRQVAVEDKPDVIAAAELVCDEWLEARPEYERLQGVEMLEVRMRTAHKGSAVAWVRERIPGASVIAIGDDETDEDMFAALRDDELGICVGTRRGSRGNAWLRGTEEVRALLRWLIRARHEQVETPPELEPIQASTGGSKRAQLLVVSNRTPPAQTGRQRSVGGLVSALEPALQAAGGMWLGWSGHERDGTPMLVLDETSQPVRACFDLSHRWREKFYTGFCNRALWPLFHGFPSRVRFADEDWDAYVEANDTYARFAHELVDARGTVWAHDYHLLLLARAMRRRGFTGRIGLFLHIPFPPQELFDTLPWRDELLDAIREFDLVGFHTAQWADNFRASLEHQELRCPSDTRRTPVIGVHPIGIDARVFAPTGEAVEPEVAGLMTVLGPRRLILGVDRLDYAKGIFERLEAYERLLEHHPEWRNQISLLQISVPSRSDVPDYAELRHKLETLVGRINGRFGEADWVPVRYLYRSYDHRVLAQLYRVADVALVTPLRDGMNLVAKEFVAAQVPNRPGVLVLSKFAGAAAELTAALLTNPYHIDGLADDLDRALRMPLDERIRRHCSLAAAIAGTTPAQWAGRFLDQLAASSRPRHLRPVPRVQAGSALEPLGAAKYLGEDG
jgi:trehalose 6-phosphate synthase